VIHIKSLNIILIVIVGAIVGLLLYGLNFYNNLQTKVQGIDSQWAQVETQYQRRFDLIPNLVNSVKGIFTQEQKVFGDIAEARTRYSGAQSVDEKVAAAGNLDSALSRLLVIVENYPNLKSDTAVASLMDELAGTENRVSVERRRFNEVVQDYNTTIKRIPGSFLASLFGFKERAYFQSVSGAEKAPEVKF
jgi:LemA protein